MTPSERDARVERFAELLAGCQRQVFLYVIGLVHRAADAEEVLQETNLVLWRKFDQYREGSEFASWACGVARFEVLHFLAKKRREERLFSDEFVESLAADPLSEDVLETRREALQQCLTRLADLDRQLVHRRYQPSTTTRSLAESLGRSVQGTRKALHRIRMSLMACVQRTAAREDRP